MRVELIRITLLTLANPVDPVVAQVDPVPPVMPVALLCKVQVPASLATEMLVAATLVVPVSDLLEVAVVLGELA